MSYFGAISVILPAVRYILRGSQNAKGPILLLCLLSFMAAASFAAEPFQLGAEEKGYTEGQTEDYPAPKMVPAPVNMPPALKSLPKPQAATITQPPLTPKASTSMILSGGVEKVILPPPFLGVWNVQGQRTKVEALPDFQAAAEQAFATATQSMWEISGDQTSGYMLSSNTGVKTQLVVDKVQGNTAFVRYQHPINNTTAQEAIVMTLVSSGAQFNGLERITIVKSNQPPRARVTYQLTGYRQR